MCGRYYVDDDTAIEIEKIVRDIDKKNCDASVLHARDIHPNDYAPVLVATQKKVGLGTMRWGYPGFDGTRIIFNARSETVIEKKMFREAVESRRIVVPAAGFYEWSRNKEKNVFFRSDGKVLFMAGIYNRYSEEDRFTILTTQANASMEPVHDRMPLILESEEVFSWLFEGAKRIQILKKIPQLLERHTEYEQMSLF